MSFSHFLLAISFNLRLLYYIAILAKSTIF
nr:MAG TPA: hypothetical protein [Caudoviricetes sp.]